jgi:hypothetical protein
MSSTEEYDRITETSPPIDKDMIALFKTTFDGTFNSTDIRALFQEIAKPDILDKLTSVKKSVYKEVDKFAKEDAILDVFSKKFNSELGRSPTRDELLDNLSSEDIKEEHIDRFIRKNQIEEV